MIYCPHCRKPSARNQGACPHCGQDLTSAAAPAKSPPAGQADSARPAPERKAALAASHEPGSDAVPLSDEYAPPADMASSGLELDAEPAQPPPRPAAPAAPARPQTADGVPQPDTGHLDLASIPPRGPAAAAPGKASARGEKTSEEMDETAVRDAARFGHPKAGLVGTMQYAWRVYNRRKELALELEKAAAKSRTAAGRKLELAAELGRKAHQIGFFEEGIEGLYARAVAPAADLSAMERKQSGLSEEHKHRVAPLDKKIQEIDAEAAPIRAGMDKATGEFRRLDVERKRIEADKKRVEAELHNLDEQIANRQAAYSDLEKPKEERKKLLDEITSFDRKRPPVMARVEALDKELGKAIVPIAAIEAELAELRDRFNEKMVRIRALTQERSALLQQFAAQEGEVAKELKEQAAKVEAAWSVVGEWIASERCDAPELKDMRLRVRGSMEAAADAAGKVDLLTRAQDAYDHGVVDRAKKIAIAAGAAVVVLLIVLAVI